MIFFKKRRHKKKGSLRAAYTFDIQREPEGNLNYGQKNAKLNVAKLANISEEEGFQPTYYRRQKGSYVENDFHYIPHNDGENYSQVSFDLVAQNQKFVFVF